MFISIPLKDPGGPLQRPFSFFYNGKKISAKGMIPSTKDYFFFELDDAVAQQAISEKNSHIKIENQIALTTAPFHEALILGWNFRNMDAQLRSHNIQLKNTARYASIFFIPGTYQESLPLIEVLAIVDNTTEYSFHKLFMDKNHNWIDPGLGLLSAGDAATNKELKITIKRLLAPSI